MTETLPQQSIGVNPCEGCPWAGAVTRLSPDNAIVLDESYPGSTQDECDISTIFEGGGARTGELVLRAEGEANPRAAVIDEIERRVKGCTGPLTGRSSNFLAGTFMRQRVTECGGFHRKEKNGKIYPDNIIHITNAGEANK